MNIESALLRSYVTSERELRRNLEQATRQRSLLLRGRIDDGSSDTEVASTILQESELLQIDATQIIAEGRQRSRDRAWKSFALLLAFIGVRSIVRESQASLDLAQAQLASRGLAQSFANSTRQAVSLWRTESGSLGRHLRDSDRRFPSLVARTSSTETSFAYNHELLVQGRVRGAKPRALIWTWQGSLEGRKCRICAALHGTSVNDGELFEYDGRSLWAPIHARCQCMCVPSAAGWLNRASAT